MCYTVPVPLRLLTGHPNPSDALDKIAQYDDSPKKLAADQFREAISAYVERFKACSSPVFANAANQLEATDVTSARCSPTFWLGRDGQADLPST